jgi:hypothetical protein
VRPRLLPIFAIISAVCCLLLYGLWAWSYRTGWELCRVCNDGTDYVVSLDGGTLVASRGITASVPSVARWEWASGPAERLDWGEETGRPEFRWFGAARTASTWTVWVPMWFPAMFTALPPALWWRQRCRRHARDFPVEAAQDA